MGDNHSFLALDWVKGEIEETLKQARQALEAHVENPEDATRMRFCLAYLHQVYGTLQMVEFYGAALLAEEMEKLCLALINGQVARVAEGQEVLMRAILQLPPYLERVLASRRDLPVVLLPLLNDLRAVRGESLLSETALFTPDLAAGERAPIQVQAQPADPALIKKIRQMYQVALLGLIRHDKQEQSLAYMDQVFTRLEKISGASAMRELWQVAAAVVEGLGQGSIDAGTSIKMLMGHVDRQLRQFGDDDKQRPPTELMKNLLYYVAKSPGNSSRLRAVKDLYRLDDALPTDALVSEERARMSGPDREAMKSVVDALGEELARVKDALDLFVRASTPNIAELSPLVPVLKQVADTVAVLGLGQPRRILQEQIEVIDGIIAANELPKDGRLLDVAGALLYVEATLNGMVAEKPLSPDQQAPDLSGQTQLSEAQGAVLRESRSALERSKDAVIEFIASQWNPVHLEPIPELLATVRGGLSILGMPRPAGLLARAGHYIGERLLKDQHRPDWAEMDTLADIITSVEYFLERVANDSHGHESVLDVAEAGLGRLGYGEDAQVASVQDADEAEESEAPDEFAENDIELSVAGDDAVSLTFIESEPLEAVSTFEESADDVFLQLEDMPADDVQAEPETISLDVLADEIVLELDAMPDVADGVTDTIELQDAAPIVADEADEFLSLALSDDEPVGAVADDAAGMEEISLAEADDPFAELALEEPALRPAVSIEDSLVDAAPDEILAEAIPDVVPEPAPAPVAAAKPVLPVLTRMPEDDHDFDEEIREIFVEEAEEVLETINSYFPRWAANFEQRDALVEFRRGFHTLKGSGRMVGAKVVGELAWSVENMLNKVRDNIVQPGQAMVSLISEVLVVVPGLVQDFQNRRAPYIDTSPLMTVAEALGRGESLSAVDVAQAAERAHAQASDTPEADGDSADSSEFDALVASLAVQPAVSVAELPEVADELSLDELAEPAVFEPELIVAELPADAFEVTLEDSSEPVADLPFGELDAELAALDEEAAPATADVDPILLEIFTSEADSHLLELAAYLGAIAPERSSAVISDQVLRSLHTLKGSAGMAGIAPVADLAAPLEHLFKDLRNQDGLARRNHLDALQQGHDLIRESIRNLIDGGAGTVPGADDLIRHIRKLDQTRLADLERSEAERLDLDMGAQVPANESIMAATAGRVATFMALGLDHVLDAPWELDGWLRGSAREENLAQLRDELLRLAPAARRADIESLALTTERLATLYGRLQAGSLAESNELLSDLAAAHDDIINVFDTLAASQTVEPNTATLERLLDWIEAPAPVLDDEPAVTSFQVDEKATLAELLTDGIEDNAAASGLSTVDDESDLDPELLEIFLEEAEEVLDAADQELSAWKADTSTRAPLAALQRQLHTLKGGARLAEIRQLGDLAHELEFLYEGLTDGRYQPEPALIDLIQRCHDRLADMVSELRDSSRCRIGSADLVNAINQYRRHPEGGVVLLADSAVQAEDAPAESVELVDATDWDAVAEAMASDIVTDELVLAADAVAAEFVTQESTAADALSLVTEAADEALPLADDNRDAIAEEDAFAEFERELEAMAEAGAQDASSLVADAEPVPARDEPAITVESIQAALAPDAPAALFDETFPAEVGGVSQPPAVAESDFDPELLEIFLEEAGEIVEATSEQLSAWLADTNNTLPLQQLQRGLHTLKGGARMAEIKSLGDLSHQMEDLYEGLADGIYTATPALFQLLQRCHDRLAVAVENLQSGQGSPATTDLQQQIQRYAADPLNFQDSPVAVALTPHVPEPVAEPDVPMVPPAPKAFDAADVPDQVDAEILGIFFEESDELVEGIESAIASWQENRDSQEPMEALLRHLHTLKGGARLAGLRELGNLAHEFETDLVSIQQGSTTASPAFFDGLGARLDPILAQIKSLREQASQPAVAEVVPAIEPEAPVVADVVVAAVVESVAEQPAAEVLLQEPVTAEVVTSPVVADVAKQQAVVPVAASTSQHVAVGGAVPPPMSGGFKSQQGRGPQEMIRVPSELLEKLVNLAGETSITRSRVEMGVHGFTQTVEEMGATISRLAEQLRRMDSEMETQIVARHSDEGGKYEDFDPLEMDQYSSLNQLSKALAESASDLLDLKATLLDKTRDTETLLLQQSRINTELQEGLMRSRMVPFSRLVPRLKRIVRQTGQEIGKPADLDVINAEGEMDRTLLERVVAPLEHMLRNAVDHGIEKPDARAAAGKVAQGRVTLSLVREGGDVVLTLSDDGAGINVAAVRKKAVERGLIAANADISDHEVIQFIFHAGFSTAEKVTQISGRGVGMDVVQSEIKQMGGHVTISSETGKGSTFTIRLPFTVAVNRALMVRIGEDVYAIPLSQIEGIVRASPYELEAYYAPGAPLFEYAGLAYKLNYLGEFVHGVRSPNLLGHTLPLPVLLIRGGEQRIAIQVDQLIGSREIVVKSVGLQLASVAGISGATILGDGSVVIILDVVAMLRAASLSQPRLGTARVAALPDESEASRTRTVMVVDDSVTVRKVTSRLLERQGYEVLLAKDGMDAIAKLEDQRPDVMLLDIEMPRMDGFEVASLVRHNPNLEDLPIIMITSRTGEKHRERAFQIGVNAYMGKPFQEDQLLETIAELLAASAAAKA